MGIIDRWKDAPGFEALYEINPQGFLRVHSARPQSNGVKPGYLMRPVGKISSPSYRIAATGLQRSAEDFVREAYGPAAAERIRWNHTHRSMMINAIEAAQGVKTRGNRADKGKGGRRAIRMSEPTVHCPWSAGDLPAEFRIGIML